MTESTKKPRRTPAELAAYHTEQAEKSRRRAVYAKHEAIDDLQRALTLLESATGGCSEIGAFLVADVEKLQAAAAQIGKVLDGLDLEALS